MTSVKSAGSSDSGAEPDAREQVVVRAEELGVYNVARKEGDAALEE